MKMELHRKNYNDNHIKILGNHEEELIRHEVFHDKAFLLYLSIPHHVRMVPKIGIGQLIIVQILAIPKKKQLSNHSYIKIIHKLGGHNIGPYYSFFFCFFKKIKIRKKKGYLQLDYQLITILA